ncbi:Hypp903 [Branchiostoma lanceolatum]|uniref:Hypp903 protein n=1 Tax=Branchiostoma lanceolatum TaxID=7740 RepID=A0A8K0EIB4_BRALA|nr:Hypp903 [Branchiostoma lanceolatum]
MTKFAPFLYPTQNNAELTCPASRRNVADRSAVVSSDVLAWRRRQTSRADADVSGIRAAGRCNHLAAAPTALRSDARCCYERTGRYPGRNGCSYHGSAGWACYPGRNDCSYHGSAKGTAG